MLTQGKIMRNRISRWVAAPAIKNDREKSRSAAVLNIVLWMFIIGASVYGLFAPIDPQYVIRRAIIIVPFLMVLLILKQLLNSGYVHTVGIMIVVAMWLVFTAAMLFGADYNNPAFMGYLIVVVTAGLVLNWKAAIGWSIFSILTNAVILTLGEKGYLTLSQGETPPLAFWAAQTVYIIVTTALLSQAIRKIDEAFENAQHEIRERSRVEAEREMFIKELESKNAELERFTYTVSHDLKSPLITISGYLGFLENDAMLEEKDKFKNDVNRIREATEKMQALLNDLLELSRVGRLMNPPEEIGFGQIVQEAMSIVDISLRQKNIKVIVQKDMPKVYVDRPRLVEVMQNLLDNAAKFMGNQPEPCIEIGINTQNDTRVFFVKDNGIGIDIAHHERVFGLFNKLDTQSEGTGIGLALVKRTIEVHGGTIWIDSRAGKGTTFYFTLPEKSNS
jgi:signal transduction histidine kinase